MLASEYMFLLEPKKRQGPPERMSQILRCSIIQLKTGYLEKSWLVVHY